MESLLSVAFDNISSRDCAKVRKGLRQIDGLLAEICLSRPTPRSPQKRKSSVLSDSQHVAPKNLHDLGCDPAFREFFRLQEGFQWNVASRLIATIERLMGMGNPSQADLLILSALDLLKGILLLHPPSRCLFNREITMNMLLDLLDSANPPRVQSQALLVLVAALLDCPRNTRMFEDVDGLLTITSLFKSRDTPRDVKLRTLEFLYFYLMPEVAHSTPSLPLNCSMPQRGASKLENAFAGHARTHSGESGMNVDAEDELHTRSMEEKQELLGEYLSNVAELVQDLHESAPFGVVVP